MFKEAAGIGHKQRKLVTDYFMPVRWAPENPLQNYLALGLANNVKDSASEKTRERVIGVRGPSLWQAALEHPGYDRLPTDDRLLVNLLLCCCMNIDPREAPRVRLRGWSTTSSSTSTPSSPAQTRTREKKHPGRANQLIEKRTGHRK